MQIELIGCTSAGKTTLAKRMVQAGCELGIDTWLSDDFILKQIRLNWIKNEFVRRRVIELWSLLTCAVFWRKYHQFIVFAVRTSLQAPGSWFYRVNVARIALRKIGIYEIIRRCSSDQQVILVDNEGVLQTPHTLFVHTTARLNTSALSAFDRIVPLPDVVVYIRQPEAVLIERIMKRGHNRIAVRSYNHVVRFVKRAIAIFDNLIQSPIIKGKLLIIDDTGNIIVPQNRQNDPWLVLTLKLIRNSMQVTSKRPSRQYA